MCKLIAELLGTDKRVLQEILKRMELSSGAPGVDVRLTAEIYGSLRMKSRELGLDPNDTTPQELYGALLNLTALHDKFLAAKIGVHDRHNPDSVLPAVIDCINKMALPKQVWALKQSAGKRLLRTMPPKTLMAKLHYRSVDSMLKREPISMLLTVARHVEPDVWQKRFVQSYKRLESKDFEVRNVETMYMNKGHWKEVGSLFVTQKRSSIIHAPEVAAIAILALPKRTFDGLTLMSLLSTVHYINEIKAYSTYIKFHYMRPDFGKFLVSTLLQPKTDHARVAGHPIHWNIVHQHYGSDTVRDHPEIFEPHIQPEDMFYRKAEALLYRLEPALHFWNNLDYAGLPQANNGPISFNLTDMAMNLMNGVPFERRINYHMQSALWNELYLRYVSQPSLERNLVEQLDSHNDYSAVPMLGMELAW